MSTPFPYPEQRTTAEQILSSFADGTRQVLLTAEMQSGKSGIFLYVAMRMLLEKTVERVVIICGSNEIELHNQLIADRDSKKSVFCHSLTYQEYQRVSSIEVHKSSDLAKAPLVDANTLLIWDESHFAQTIENLPYKFLTNSGLAVTGTAASDATWGTKNSYFLSVSATPFAEFSDAHNKDFVAMITRAVVRHVPSKMYRGVAFYKAAGVIRPSFSIKKDPHEFTALLIRHKAPAKYALIRSYRNLDVVRACCASVGILYKEYTSTKAEIEGLDALEVAPTAFTVIGLKGMCRMGKVVPKSHIAVTFEDAQQSKSDCVLQSFLGRMCGHGPFPTDVPTLYVSPAFLITDKKTCLTEVERYTRYADGEAIIPAKAACISPGKSVSGKFTLEPKLIPLADEDPEDYGVGSVARDAIAHRDRLSVYAAAALTHLATHPYTDATQHAEAIARIADLSFIELHNLNAVTYDYARDAGKGVAATLARGGRWDDHWNAGKYFKFYYTASELYLVGYTDKADYGTEMECIKAVLPTTGKEIWNPTRATQRLNVVRSETDLKALATNLQLEGQHTVFAHKTLARNPLITALVKNASKGKGGKNWPGEKVDRELYLRIVIMVTVEIRVTISATVY